MTDRDRFNQLYRQVRDFDVPDFEEEDFQNLAKLVKEGLEIILDGMKRGAESIRNNKEEK